MPVSKIWKLKVPPKVKTYMWLVIKERLQTRNIMRRKGMDVSPVCVLCSSDDESVAHLYLQCSFVRELADYKLKEWGISTWHVSLLALLDHLEEEES